MHLEALKSNAIYTWKNCQGKSTFEYAIVFLKKEKNSTILFSISKDYGPNFQGNP